MNMLELLPDLFANQTRLTLRMSRVGDEKATNVVVDRFPTVIGRSNEVDLLIADKFVSHIHCLLNCVDGVFVIQDLESRNGTEVNGRSIRIKQLEEGDVIIIGATRISVFRSMRGCEA